MPRAMMNLSGSSYSNVVPLLRRDPGTKSDILRKFPSLETDALLLILDGHVKLVPFTETGPIVWVDVDGWYAADPKQFWDFANGDDETCIPWLSAEEAIKRLARPQ